jgi:hypothetical protein
VDAIDDLVRLALFEAWGEKCVWCGRPLHFNEMEVEHLLPRSLGGDEKVATLQSHGLEEKFDLEVLENLAPSCGPCNRGKEGITSREEGRQEEVAIDRWTTRPCGTAGEGQLGRRAQRRRRADFDGPGAGSPPSSNLWLRTRDRLRELVRRFVSL